MANNNYDVDNLKNNKGGFTREKQMKGDYKAGVYQHPEAKDANGNPVEIATKYDPLFGDVQSEAVARLGYVRVGNVPEGYNKETAPDFASNDKDSGSLKGIQARLDALEAENAKLRAEKQEAADAAAAKAAEEASKVKPFEKLNSVELRELAAKEDVNVEGSNSNNELRAAIQKARDEKEGN